MTARRVSHAVMELAQVLAPRARKDWITGMARELDVISADGEALFFALGCLAATLSEHLKMQEPITIARRGVAAITALYAVMHLTWALNGVNILFGHPDPFCEMLEASGNTAAAARHAAMHPWIVAYQLGIGFTHLAAAATLAWWCPRLFWIAIGLAVIPAAFTIWPLVPLAMLAAAGFMLVWMNRDATGTRTRRVLAPVRWLLVLAAAGLAFAHLRPGVMQWGTAEPLREAFMLGCGFGFATMAVGFALFKPKILMAGAVLATAGTLSSIVSYLQTMPEFRGVWTVAAATSFNLTPVIVFAVAAYVLVVADRGAGRLQGV